MAEPVYIGHELKVLNHKIRRLAEGNMAQHPCGGMTEVQGRVLGYLTHHPGRDICQRRRPSASPGPRPPRCWGTWSGMG